MANPFTEKLEKIEIRLAELNNTINSKSSCFQQEILDNDEFQGLFNISQGTAANWREQGVIGYFQIKNKIYYKVEDVRKLIESNYKPLKKK